MPSPFRTRRWSTAGVAGISLGLSTLAYFAGRNIATTRLSTDSANATAQQSVAASVTPVAPIHLATPEATPSPASNIDFDARWKSLATEQRSPRTEREMAAALEELAARDPKQALALALAEKNFRLRGELRQAVLRGWASAFPDDAANYALAITDGEQQLALQAVFAGAARRPQEAARLGARLCAETPARASDFGQFLVNALAEAGAYSVAAAFAAADTSGNREAWLNYSYSEWGAHQPEQALTACQKISDPAVRDAAFQGTISGWAQADPPGLAAYAMSLSAGTDRVRALEQALPRWVSNDPVAASKWIAEFDPSPDLDAGVAAVASLPLLINQRPEVAVQWASNIAEPVLRANVLGSLAREWAQKDPEAVRRFIASKPDLSVGDRTALQDALNPPPDA